MAEEVVCTEYASSLEDLSFNSKPLINVLTMLAEENVQQAEGIIKLIEKRIYEVDIDKKLPALYLMDSIVKNIGNQYITAVSPCIVALFTHVFEQADEKTRLAMFRLRNTWPNFFTPKILHELDCSVNKRDPGWPVIEPPPPSPSIHVNPRFLSKVEENVDSQTSCSSSDEAKIMDEFEKKKNELGKLQGDEMRTQMMQLEELQMKYELIKKKQEKDRLNLLKQQKEKILKMRLQQEELVAAQENVPVSKAEAASTSIKNKAVDVRIVKIKEDIDSQSTDDTEESQADTETDPSDKMDVDSSSEGLIIIEKQPDKVGFDSEFVPLDQDNHDTTNEPVVVYNRDRPLGKNRYFKKDPKAKIIKSESDSDSDLVDVKDSDNDEKNVEDKKGIKRGAIGHRNYRRRKEGDHANEKPSQMEDRRKPEQSRDRKQNTDDVPNSRSDLDDTKARDPFPGRHRRSEHSDLGNRMRGQGRRGNRHDAPDDRPDGPDRRAEGRISRHGDRPGGDRFNDRSGRRPEDRFPGRRRPGFSVRGRMSQRDMDKRFQGRTEEGDSIRGGRYDNRHDGWGRGRGQRRPFRGRGFSESVDGHPRDYDRPFERGFVEEPPFKRSRPPSPPRPLFSAREISEIRERRESPKHAGHVHGPPDEFVEPWLHENLPHAPHEFYDGPPEHLGPGPRHFPHPHLAPRNHQRLPDFPGGVEIPVQLNLDNESELMRNADYRLRNGDLSQEQHRDLMEKLGQFYELQKWQRRHSTDMPIPPHSFHDRPPFMLPQPASHPSGIRGGMPLPDSNTRAHESRRNNDRLQGGNDVLPHQDNMMTDGRSHTSLPDSMIPTANFKIGSELLKSNQDNVPPSSLGMEKQAVDDLFKKLMDVGIIKKVNETGCLSPARVSTPPTVDSQILNTITIPEVQQEIPEIKLTLDHLRRRYDYITVELHRGTQCSSCGLRFREENNEKYRQHLDWHFRINRKEKEIVAAHRNWFITTDDWLVFESSEVTTFKARSTVFEEESDGESEKTEDLQEGSCPALIGDTETERQCDICMEKFDTFWDETSEDWHYRNATRVDGKTYHYLCYQDAKETNASDMDGSDELDNTHDISHIDDSKPADSQKTDEESLQSNIISNDEKSSIVTLHTTLQATVESVVHASDGLGVNNANKDTIKTES